MDDCEFCGKPTRAKPRVNCTGDAVIVLCRDCQQENSNGDHDYCPPNCEWHKDDDAFV